MNPITLVHTDGTPTGIWYCAKCRAVSKTKEEAEQCCQPRKCECGATLARGLVRCDDCWHKHDREVEAARFAKAEKVTAWDGCTFQKGMGFNEGFMFTHDELDDALADLDPANRPEYVWTCKPVRFAIVDIDDIFQRIEEDGDASEDFVCRESMMGIEALQAAIEAFNAANTGVVSYQPDYSRALVLEKQKEEA